MKLNVKASDTIGGIARREAAMSANLIGRSYRCCRASGAEEAAVAVVDVAVVEAVKALPQLQAPMTAC